MGTLSVLAPSLAAIVGLVALSAFFSSSESALFSLDEEWIQETATDGTPESAALGALRADPHKLLVTILVGNNLVNIAITSIVTLLVAEFVPPGATIVVTTIGASVLILVFGEIVPKSYGLGHAQTWCLRVARPLTAVQRVLSPLVWLFDASTQRLTRWVGGDQHIEDPYLDS